MPKPAHAPTKESRSTVAIMLAAGIDQPTICACVGLTEKTLRKYYRRELDTTYATVKADIAGKLINKARAGDLKAQIFYLETHGWVRAERVTVADGGYEDSDPVTLTDAELEARIGRLRRTAAVTRAMGK